MGLGGYFTPNLSTDAEIVATLRLAFDNGMTFVDTAEVYAAGHSEELVGHAIDGQRQRIYLATKVAPEHLCRTDLVTSVDASLKRLCTDWIDLYQVHWPNPKVPIDETMGALEGLVKAGKILHIGLSNFSLKELQNAQSCLKEEAIAAVQVEYNLFDRSIERVFLPYCQKHGIAVVAYSPLDQGYICGGPKRCARIEPVAERNSCTMAELALAWLIRKPGVLAIPKAAKPAHVISNATAGDIELSPGDIEAIDQLTADNLVKVSVDRIRAVSDDNGQRKVYRTVEEAQANIYGFTPSPMELACGMRAGDFLKPIRVRPTHDLECGYDYDLIEGRIRYWAWVIAFNGQRDIPALVRE